MTKIKRQCMFVRLVSNQNKKNKKYLIKPLLRLENSLDLNSIYRALVSLFYEVILKRFSTSFNWSLLDKSTTVSSF